MGKRGLEFHALRGEPEAQVFEPTVVALGYLAERLANPEVAGRVAAVQLGKSVSELTIGDKLDYGLPLTTEEYETISNE